jgi:hypothetical protein
LGKGKFHLGKIKLPFRPKWEEGQSIQNKLFHTWWTIVRIQQQFIVQAATIVGRMARKSTSAGQFTDDQHRDCRHGSLPEEVSPNSVAVKALHYTGTSAPNVRRTLGRCLGAIVQDFSPRICANLD